MVAKETTAQRKATLSYRKKAVTQLNVALYPSDADIIEWLAEKPSKAAYIRELIRKDMQRR